MQVLDEKKRQRILKAASELFTARAFHQVVLSDVAARAKVGKGTLYTYFASKEDLYLGVIYEGFASLVGRLETCLGNGDQIPEKALELVVRELVGFAWQHPALFEFLRHVPPRESERTKWLELRRQLTGMIADVIRQGNAAGDFDDPEPQLTARFIPGMVRASLLDRPDRLPRKKLEAHILRFLLAGLTAPSKQS